jgi:hypothetical protein
MTVAELLARITSAELAEWVAYFHVRRMPEPAESADEKVRKIFGRPAGG